MSQGPADVLVARYQDLRAARRDFDELVGLVKAKTMKRLMQAASDIFLGWPPRQAWTTSSQTFISASWGTGNSPFSSRSWRRAAFGSTANCAGGRWLGHTHAPATGSPSPPTSAAPASSTRPSPGSPPPTPTRTNATTNHSWTPSPPDGSPPDPTCKIPAAALTGELPGHVSQPDPDVRQP
jgi:hypothetical protein